MGSLTGQGYLYGFPESAENIEAELAQMNLLLDIPLPQQIEAEAKSPIARSA